MTGRTDLQTLILLRAAVSAFPVRKSHPDFHSILYHFPLCRNLKKREGLCRATGLKDSEKFPAGPHVFLYPLPVLSRIYK